MQAIVLGPYAYYVILHQTTARDTDMHKSFEGDF